MIAVIPGGLMSLMQPLDFCLSKHFMDRAKWMDWMATGNFECTPTGNFRCPAPPLVAAWVKEAWDKMGEDMIIKSILKCGFLNNLDGTKDDAL